MTCDQAIELLPWFLNGTLESGELADVRQHLETCASCRAALAETGQAWSVFSQETAAQHIPAEDMVALAWGEPPAGIEQVAAETHLASCAECSAELEMTRMSRRLGEEDNVALFPGAKPRSRTGAAPWHWRAAAIAASLTAVVAAGGWLHAVHQPLPLAASQQASAPQSANVIDLGNSDAIRGLESGTPVRWDRLSTLLLPAAKDANTPVLAEREAEIVDGTGKVVWKEPHLQPAEIGSYYSIALPPRSLSPGRYTLQLFSREAAGARVPREAWRLEVVEAPTAKP
ncbi:MAG TPA: zf-HC2 domain-containing protein [Thermoanaerobaculia bacterium]|nr:zf-HC2 domain-containing protein [Thermoanaerobaculia bacterium]